MMRERSWHSHGAMKLSLQLPLALLVCVHLGCGGEEDPGSPGGNTAGTPNGGVGGSSVGGAATAGGGASSGGASGQAGSAGAGGTNGGSSSTAGAAGSSSGGAGGGASGAAGAAGSAGSAGSAPTDGPSLYQANCQLCHGEQGVGGPLGPEIQHPVRDYSSWVVRHGRAQTTFPKPMDPVAPEKLSDASLTLIWNYLDLPPQPTTGQALFHDYCANCHGADGQGGPTTRPIVNELGMLKQHVRAGAHLGEFDQRREYMPAFKTDEITDAELDLIYTFVDSL